MFESTRANIDYSFIKQLEFCLVSCVLKMLERVAPLLIPTSLSCITPQKDSSDDKVKYMRL